MVFVVCLFYPEEKYSGKKNLGASERRVLCWLATVCNYFVYHFLATTFFFVLFPNSWIVVFRPVLRSNLSFRFASLPRAISFCLYVFVLL